jgi:hypothetical protein
MMNDEKYIKVDIYTVDQEIILSTKNFNIEGNRMILKGLDLPRVEHKATIKAVGYLKDGIVIMEGKVTISTDLQINMDILDYEEKQERRENVKVKTEFRSRILKAYRSEKSKKGLLVNEDIQTRDISVGGICFYSNRIFLKNQVVFFEFNQSKRPFVIEAMIIRKEFEKNKIGYRYRYGCKFVNLTNSQQQSICEYVFKVELENYRKSL